MRVWITGWTTNDGGHRGYTYAATKKEAMQTLRENLSPLSGLSKEEREDEDLADLSGFYVDTGDGLDSVVAGHLPDRATPLSDEHGSLGQFIGYVACPGLGEGGLGYLQEFGAHADNGLG